MFKTIPMLSLLFAGTVATAVPEFRLIPNSAEDYVRATYEVKGEAPRLSIHIEGDTTSDNTLHAECKDFWGNPVSTVEISHTDEQDIYELRPQVAEIGWYRIELWLEQDGQKLELKRIPGEDRSLETYNYLPFAIVPKPTAKENSRAKSPFGMDTAFSSKATWLPPTELHLELIRLSGADWVRDRFSWKAVSPIRGEYNWDHYKQRATQLHENGFKAVQIIQRPIPEWMRAETKDHNSFPGDLRDAYDFGISASQNLFPAVTAFEIWNEHDIGHYANRPPDVYASTLKAIALGLKDGGRGDGPTTLIGAFARNPNVGNYADILGANEIAPYLDAYNFHTYEPASNGQLERVMTTQLEVHQKMGFGSKPIWLTETGRVYGRDAIPEPQEAMKLQVDYLFDTYLTAFDHEIGPVFWFWLTPYYGSSLTAAKDRIPLQFGMIDSYWAPFPVYSAYAWMASILGEAKEVAITTWGSEQARIFNSGKELVALIRPTKTETPIELPRLDDNAKVYNVFGTPLEIEHKADGTALVPNNGFPIYVSGQNWDQLSTKNSPDEAAKITEVTNEGSPIVIQITYPRENIDYDSTRRSPNWDGLNSNWTPRGYTFESGEDIPLIVSIYNFGSSKHEGTLKFELPDGIQASQAELPYSIEAGARLEYQLTIHTEDDAPELSRWKCQAVSKGSVKSINVSQWRKR